MQGVLVNGSVGKVVGFKTTREALDDGIMVGVPDGQPTPGSTLPDAILGGKKESLRRSLQARKLPRTPGSQVPEPPTRSAELWPVVRFNKGSIYGGPIDILCVPSRFEVVNARGKVEARREQVCIPTLSYVLRVDFSSLGTVDSGLGPQYPQKPRPDSG